VLRNGTVSAAATLGRDLLTGLRPRGIGADERGIGGSIGGELCTLWAENSPATWLAARCNHPRRFRAPLADGLRGAGQSRRTPRLD
jgi:hypothetical protein